MDRQGRCLTTNESGLMAMGFTEKQMSGKSFCHIWPDDVQKMVDQHIAEVLVGSHCSFDAHRICNDEIQWWNVSLVPLVNKQGIVDRFISISSDITVRKNAEIRLQENEERLKTIIETIPSPLFFKSADGVFIGCNSAYEEYIGAQKSSIIDATINQLVPQDIATIFHDAEVELLKKQGKQVYEWRLRFADGSIHDVKVFYASYCNSKNEIQGLVGLMLDITELKKTQNELQNHVKHLHSILDNNPACLKIVDEKGVLLDINPAGAELLAVPSKEAVVGKKFADFIDQDYRESYRRFTDEICQGNKGEFKYELCGVDGSKHQMESIAVPLPYGEDGKIVTLSISRDVTEAIKAAAESEKLRDQLRQVQKLEAIGTLAGGIAHDFNNILTGIFGYAELAKMAAPKGSTLEEDIDEVLKASNRAKELVKQILTFGRQADKHLMPQRAHVIIKEAIKLLRASLPSTIEIRQDIDHECKPILADYTQVHQVLMNLCTNAYHAIGSSSGLVMVSLSEVVIHKQKSDICTPLNPGIYAMLEVSDTGVGMSKTTMDKIFEPYYTTKELGKGSGFGLAVVHGIVQSHGGHICVDSEVGSGSVFRIYFPCVDSMPESESLPMGLMPSGNERIMVVDDEEIIINMEQRFLESCGYQVYAFQDSLKAYQFFIDNSDSIDLIITDMSMPNLTGVQLSRDVLQIKPNMAIILCTGYSDVIDEEKALELGVKEYLIKPIVQMDLAVKVRKTLDGISKD